jgi:hypothetical protein
MRYACASMISGIILRNKDKAIVINCVEIYGRTKTVDSHRESFRCKKGLPLHLSSLPPHNCRYKKIWTTTVSDNDGKKLIIGTKTFNALVTSSLRLDTVVLPDIGPSTTNFMLEGQLESMEAKIFINRESLNEAIKLAENPNTNSIYEYDTLYQLRQLRTRFHHHSTYFRCRASSSRTNSHTVRPYTIFALADYDNGHDESDGRTGSLLFRSIGISVLQGNHTNQFGENVGCLDKTLVQQLKEKCNKDSNVKKILHSITELYEPDTQEIPIIGNPQLNTWLQMLSQHLSPYITRANRSVSETIMYSFSRAEQ